MTDLRHYCLDCQENQPALPGGRCPRCGGFQVSTYNRDNDCGAWKCSEFGCFGYCGPEHIHDIRNQPDGLDQQISADH